MESEHTAKMPMMYIVTTLREQNTGKPYCPITTTHLQWVPNPLISTFVSREQAVAHVAKLIRKFNDERPNDKFFYDKDEMVRWSITPLFDGETVDLTLDYRASNKTWREDFFYPFDFGYC